MATAHASWTTQILQEPTGAMDAAAWQIRVYQEFDGTLISTVTEPLATLTHDFVLTTDGDYRVGVSALDANGQMVGTEEMSAVFTIGGTAPGTVDVTRPGVVTVEVLP